MKLKSGEEALKWLKENSYTIDDNRVYVHKSNKKFAKIREHSDYTLIEFGPSRIGPFASPNDTSIRQYEGFGKAV